MLEKRAAAVRALEELLSRRRAVLAVEAARAAGVSSAVVVSVARATGYAATRVARSYGEVIDSGAVSGRGRPPEPATGGSDACLFNTGTELRCYHEGNRKNKRVQRKKEERET